MEPSSFTLVSPYLFAADIALKVGLLSLHHFILWYVLMNNVIVLVSRFIENKQIIRMGSAAKTAILVTAQAASECCPPQSYTKPSPRAVLSPSLGWMRSTAIPDPSGDTPTVGSLIGVMRGASRMIITMIPQKRFTIPPMR